MYYKVSQAQAWYYNAEKILENYPVIKEKYQFKIVPLKEKNYKLERELYVDIKDFTKFIKDIGESIVLLHPDDYLNGNGGEIEVEIYDGYLD